MAFIVRIAASIVLAGCAGPALANEITSRIEIKASTAEVWRAIGDFCGISAWHPTVTHCVLGAKDGVKLRVLTFADGKSHADRLITWSDAAKRYSYVVETGNAHHGGRVTLRVTSDDGEAVVRWKARLDAHAGAEPREREAIKAFFDAGLAALAKKIKG